MTLKLYGSARSRASIVQWYLEELELPYEFVTLDMQTGEHRQPAFFEINPFGKVPALVDGDLKLWESGAILLYLCDRYGKVEMNDRAIAAQWILFANATLGPGVFGEENREREMPRLMQPLDEIFGKRGFIAGDRFTVSDVAVGAILAYIPLAVEARSGRISKCRQLYEANGRTSGISESDRRTEIMRSRF